MDTRQLLQECLEYIDTHVTEALTLEELAGHSGYSPWHFSRLFQWTTGLSVMSYVRARRLAYAAYELGKGRKVIDVALDYGFETHSGFSKAFRRLYGCSPEKYRMHGQERPPAVPDLPHMDEYSVGGIIMEPKFIEMPARRLAGYVMHTSTEDGANSQAIPEFWTAYIHDGRMERLCKENFMGRRAEYGACFPEDPEDGGFDYMIGLEVKEGLKVPEEYDVREIPAATYVVFSTPPSDTAGFVHAIQGTWNYIYNEWFPASGYEYAPGGVDYELYDERCMKDTGKVCEIYIPIVKK